MTGFVPGAAAHSFHEVDNGQREPARDDADGRVRQHRRQRGHEIAGRRQRFGPVADVFDTVVQRRWALAGIAALLLFPFAANDYALFLACLVGIHVVTTTGLNILTGYTGLISLGQAAFMGVGAYTAALAETRLGMPFFVNLALYGLVTAAVGVAVGVPSLHVKGLYLAIATIAASFILHFVFQNWTAVTGGIRGVNLPPARMLGRELVRPFDLYWVIAPVVAVLVLAAANLYRTRIGRAFIAIRDRDISAELLGIPLLRYKLMSFGLSAFYAGVAGGLWAYLFRVVTPVCLSVSGSKGTARLTRFCTMTWAMFTSTPCLKVTVRLYEPSLVHCDDM